MTDLLSKPCTTFAGVERIAHGALVDVALAVKVAQTKDPAAAILTFDDTTGAVIDLDLRGTTADIVARLTERAKREDRPIGTKDGTTADEGSATRGRGRPKLGVVAREVTLLPRHWEWLAAQRGGASNALRRLVDEARRADGGRSGQRAARDVAYRFMSAMAGNLPGFEEASRALFAGDLDRFADHAATWPADVRTYALTLARGGESR